MPADPWSSRWCCAVAMAVWMAAAGNNSVLHDFVGSSSSSGSSNACTGFRCPILPLVAAFSLAPSGWSMASRRSANSCRFPSPSKTRKHQRPQSTTIITRLGAASDLSTDAIGSRYICLLDDLDRLEGVYFGALFDQLFELTGHAQKYLALLTTRRDLDRLASSSGSGSGATSTNDPNNDNNDNIDGPATMASIHRDADDATDYAAALASKLKTMEELLDLDAPPEVFVLDEWNPVSLEERFATEAITGSDAATADTPPRQFPTIVWLYGNNNAYYTRHLLRTSGMDRFLLERCASSAASISRGDGISDNCVFVGEGTGAACAGITMEAAFLRGDDSKKAPELQDSGLSLLGSDGVGATTEGKEEAASVEGVVFTNVIQTDTENNKKKKSTTNTSTADRYSAIEVCREDDVFVWAQPLPESPADIDSDDSDNSFVATSLVVAPNKRGTIESYEAGLKPLPPAALLSGGANRPADAYNSNRPPMVSEQPVDFPPSQEQEQRFPNTETSPSEVLEAHLEAMREGNLEDVYHLFSRARRLEIDNLARKDIRETRPDPRRRQQAVVTFLHHRGSDALLPERKRKMPMINTDGTNIDNNDSKDIGNEDENANKTSYSYQILSLLGDPDPPRGRLPQRLARIKANHGYYVVTLTRQSDWDGKGDPRDRDGYERCWFVWDIRRDSGGGSEDEEDDDPVPTMARQLLSMAA